MKKCILTMMLCLTLSGLGGCCRAHCYLDRVFCCRTSCCEQQCCAAPTCEAYEKTSCPLVDSESAVLQPPIPELDKEAAD